MKATALRRWIRDLRHAGSEVAHIFATDDTIFKKQLPGNQRSRFQPAFAGQFVYQAK
jgi:hypothetical protein